MLKVSRQSWFVNWKRLTWCVNVTHLEKHCAGTWGKAVWLTIYDEICWYFNFRSERRQRQITRSHLTDKVKELEKCFASKTALSHRITKPINGTYIQEISLVFRSVTQCTSKGCQLMMTHIFHLLMLIFFFFKCASSHILSCHQSQCIYHTSQTQVRPMCCILDLIFNWIVSEAAVRHSPVSCFWFDFTQRSEGSEGRRINCQ